MTTPDECPRCTSKWDAVSTLTRQIEELSARLASVTADWSSSVTEHVTTGHTQDPED